MFSLPHLASLVLVSMAPPASRAVQLPQQPAADKPLDASQRLLAGQRAIAGAFDRVVVDHGTNETVWASASDWKASFASSATTFVPFLGSDADRHYPLAWRLAAVTVAGTSVAFDAAAAPAATAGLNEIRYERQGLTEVYELGLEGIEQKFLFPALPSRGELRLSLHVTTELAGQPAADGSLSFTNERGGVRYGRAVAFDAVGRRCEVATRWADEQIELSVPAEFVAAAQLPLCIDPLVSLIRILASDPSPLRSVDIAFDSTLDQYAVVWGREFSLNDEDCYVQILDGAMNQIGGLLPIDLTLDSWRDSQIANLNAYDTFLVVARCYNLSSSSWVGGRIVHGGTSATMGNQFDIARAGVAGHPSGSKSSPDVGGDPETAAPTYFTVVWANENTASPGRSDILFRQITSQGAFVTPSAIVLDNAGYYCREPRISKSDGMRPFASQRWAVVWYRCTAGGSCTSPEMRAGLVRWDGHVSFFGAPLQSSFQISNQVAFMPLYDVSSPTEPVNGRRRYAFVSDRQDAATASWDIYGVVFDDLGQTLDVERNLTVLEPGTHHPLQQSSPAIDCDGTRFAVAYTELFSPTDEDVYVSTFAFDNTVGPQWLVHDPRNAAALSLDNEQEPAIVATRSGGGNGVRYGLAWRHVGSGNAWHRVEARTYDGMQAGSTFVTRATGCGVLQVAAAGVPALGQTIQFVLPNAVGAVQGFVFGVPLARPIPGCPGCLLGSDGSTLLGLGFAVTVPAAPSFVGVTFAVQGFDFAAGPCLGQITISDTIDFTIR